MAYNRLSSYRTFIRDRSVTYASTEIVSWDHNTVTLRSGGWQTVTTKRKMNQASHQFGLGYSVFQRKHEWFVTLPSGKTVKFRDGMTFALASSKANLDQDYLFGFVVGTWSDRGEVSGLA